MSQTKKYMHTARKYQKYPYLLQFDNAYISEQELCEEQGLYFAKHFWKIGFSSDWDR